MDRELTKRALALLRKLEWWFSEGTIYCSACGVKHSGSQRLTHLPDCPLAALIRDLEAAMKEAEDE